VKIPSTLDIGVFSIPLAWGKSLLFISIMKIYYKLSLMQTCYRCRKKTETMFFLRINEVKSFREDEPDLGVEEIIDELLCSKCLVELEKFLTPDVELI
jgi:hypothetical protein